MGGKRIPAMPIGAAYVRGTNLIQPNANGVAERLQGSGGGAMQDDLQCIGKSYPYLSSPRSSCALSSLRRATRITSDLSRQFPRGIE
jgi:hypothetical protein